MAPQAYNFVITHDHEITGWKILSMLLHSCTLNIGAMDGNIQSYIATLAFNNREQLEYFHSIILIFKQEIVLSGETVSPTRLLFQYRKALSESDKLKSLAAPKMKDIVTFLYNN